jgi:hypothetical protein
MKPAEQRQSDARRQHIEAIVARHMRLLFQRLPMLAGFWLRSDFRVAELSVSTWPGYTASSQLYEEVMQSLVDLAEERPEAVESMRGRTFARAVQ